MQTLQSENALQQKFAPVALTNGRAQISPHATPRQSIRHPL